MSTLFKLFNAWDHSKYLNGWESKVGGKQDEAERGGGGIQKETEREREEL